MKIKVKCIETVRSDNLTHYRKGWIYEAEYNKDLQELTTFNKLGESHKWNDWLRFKVVRKK